MNKIKLIETVTRGSHIRKTVDPGLILGNEDNGYLMGDILDANATASLIESSQLQSDWNQTDDTEKDYIKNKPDLTSMFAAKQDAPSTAGTDGQIFSLNAQGKPTWINPVEGSVVDNSMSGISTNPVQNNVIKEYVDDTVNALGEEIDSRKANKDGYYEQMGVGLAKNLEGSKITKESFFNRPTGGEDAELADGLAQLTEVKGESVKYNQLIPTISRNYTNAYTDTRDSFYFTLVGKNSSSGNLAQIVSEIISSKGRKSYIFTLSGYDQIGGKHNGSTTDVWFLDYTPVTDGHKYYISMYVNSYNTSLVGGLDLSDIYLLDLTALGIDDLTTVEEVDVWLAENWTLQEYYPYSPGAVLNVNMTGLESFKRNLLNPETGEAVIIGAYSEAYGNYYGICGTYGTLTFTDAYGNESTITPDADGKFELDVPGTLTVADAGADCAVFLWWDGTKTEFSEYGTSIAKLDIAHIYGKKNGEGDLVQVWPTGACGIGDAQDYIKIENGAVKAVKRVGSVDLGSSKWGSASFGTEHLVFYSLVADAAYSMTGFKSHTLQAKYNQLYFNVDAAQLTDKRLSTNTNQNYMYVRDDSYPSIDTFKSANQGVMLYYELATPETYTDLVYQGSSLFEDGTPVTLPVNYEADNWGIERILPVNSPEGIVTAAPTVACKYSIDAVEQLDTHTTEISDLYDKTTELNATKANKSGEYPEMVVGAAAALKGDTAQSAEFVFRKTGAPDNVASGLALIESVKGKSLVWNQLANLSNAICSDRYTIIEDFPVSLQNHRIYISSYVKKSLDLQCSQSFFTLAHSYDTYGGIVDFSNIPSDNEFHIVKGIAQSANDLNANMGVFLVDYVSGSVTIDKIKVFDLTLMFGAGNEPATVEEFEKMFPLDYYDYNSGTIINNKATGIELVGFNQLDQSGESSSQYIGHYYIDSSIGYVRAANDSYDCYRIPVFPNTTYYLTQDQSSSTLGSIGILRFVDANYEFVSGSANGYNYAGASYTTPAKARYVEMSIQINETKKVVFNLSDASRNGTYEPYKKSTVALNIPMLTGKLNDEGESVVVCADGLRGVGTAFDEGVIENGYLTKVSKHIGKQVVSGSIGDTITLTGCDTNETIFLCASEIGTLSGGVLTLTADADNVSVYFKLAEPEVYVLDEPLPVTYQVDGDGTERRLPTDTASEISAPFAALIRYSMDAVGTINNLPKDYDSTDGLDDLCSALATALGSALNGTLSITRGAYNATMHKYAWTVTFTPNAPQELGE